MTAFVCCGKGRGYGQIGFYFVRTARLCSELNNGAMDNKKHHYVPRFYLKGFQSAPRRIHLYNLQRGISVQYASLKDQCYRDRFYGPTNHIEDKLAFIEDRIAPVLQRIIASNTLPIPGTDGEWLLAFITLQLLRTTVAANLINSGIDKATKQTYSCDPRWAGVDLESVRIGYDNPVLASLNHLSPLMLAISDLSPHLIVSPGGGFITSDNPTFKYNQYCEGIQHMGVTGGLCRGLQMFIPLAPHLQLMLHDAGVYKVENGHTSVSIASQDDVDSLNAIQLVSADQNVYFAEPEQADYVRRLLHKVIRHRKTDSVRVVEYGQDDDENASLLHAFQRMPDLRLKLSFLTLKRNARRVALHDRAREFRKEPPMPSSPVPPNLAGRSAKFSRFIGQR